MNTETEKMRWAVYREQPFATYDGEDMEHIVIAHFAYERDAIHFCMSKNQDKNLCSEFGVKPIKE